MLRLIEELCRAGEPARLADLAEAAGLAKPTAHRLLGVLTEENWAVAHDGGRYGIGPAARAFAAMVGSGAYESVDSVLADLQRRIGQTIHVGMRSGDRMVYTHKVDGTEGLAMASRVGHQQPLHSTAIGKCILTSFDEAELAEFAGRAGLPPRTERTITTLDALRLELAEIRERGYAIDEQENEANIRCLAAPVRAADGRVMGAISISTVTFVMERDALLALSYEALDAAQRLTRLFA